MAFAQAKQYGRSALLLDLDLDGPGLASLLGLPPQPGLAEIVHGKAGLYGALHAVGEGLIVMTAGTISANPGQLATELLATQLLDDLQDEFDVIIADLPALNESMCGAILARAFPRPLLVVRAGVTPVVSVRKAISSLGSEPMLMLNGTRSHLPGWLRRSLSK
jgi:Mrp family chromosome partitioning ATPase